MATKKSPLKSSVLDAVRQRYDVVDILDLWHLNDPVDMISALSVYKDTCWTPSQRLIVLYHDTDYYPTLDCAGNQVYNFLKLCGHFSIPTEYILFFTNHYGLGPDVQKLSQHLCNSIGPKVIHTSLWYDAPDPDEIQCENVDTVSHLFVCLNGIQRQHRLFTLCALADRGLLDKGMISYHFGN